MRVIFRSRNGSPLQQHILLTASGAVNPKPWFSRDLNPKTLVLKSLAGVEQLRTSLSFWSRKGIAAAGRIPCEVMSSCCMHACLPECLQAPLLLVHHHRLGCSVDLEWSSHHDLVCKSCSTSPKKHLLIHHLSTTFLQKVQWGVALAALYSQVCNIFHTVKIIDWRQILVSLSWS
jgi:hypothetical protein